MDAYYINLDSATQRKILIESQKNKIDLNFEIKRFPAIRGIDHAETKPSDLSYGQWGCWLSHLEVIHRSLFNDDHLLIIEDDEHFEESFLKASSLIESISNEDWDIIYLDATFVEVFDYIKIARRIQNSYSSENFFFDIDKSFTVYGTHGYILNKNKKIKIFELLRRNSRLGIPIDNVFCAAIQQELLKAKIILPLMLSPGPETAASQISNENHPLANDWQEFRTLISNQSLKTNDFSITNGKVTEIINKRNKFSLTGEFTPHHKGLITTNTHKGCI